MSTPEEATISNLMMAAADMIADTGVQPDDPVAWAHLLMYCPRELVEARLAQLNINRLQRIEGDFQKLLAVATAPGNYDVNPYMLGMANGLILGQAIVKDLTPIYLEAPKIWLELKGKKDVPTTTNGLGSVAQAAGGESDSAGAYDEDRAVGTGASGFPIEGDQQGGSGS